MLPRYFACPTTILTVTSPITTRASFAGLKRIGSDCSYSIAPRTMCASFARWTSLRSHSAFPPVLLNEKIALTDGHRPEAQAASDSTAHVVNIGSVRYYRLCD